MARITSLLATAISALTVVSGTPTGDLSKRTPGCLFLTTGPNFTGETFHICLAANQNGQCVPFSSDFGPSIRSFGPDPGTTCTIFASRDCSGAGTGPFTTPGLTDLGSLDGKLMSTRCTF